MGKYRQSILDAARKLILKKGLFEFSMTELAKNAGVSVGTLYREIENKDDLLLLLFAELRDELTTTFIELDKVKDLTAAERIICSFGLSAYASEFENNSFGVKFLGSNLGLVRRARPEIIDEVKQIILQTHQGHFDGFAEGLDEDYLAAHESRVKLAFQNMIIVSRGLHVIKTSFIYQSPYKTVDKLCELGELFLSPLVWKMGQGDIDKHKVERVLKTLLDKKLRLLAGRG